MPTVHVDRNRIKAAKQAFSTRRVPSAAMSTLIMGDHRPNPGDVVLARVDEIGKQLRLELTNGRKAQLFPGDEIIVSYGNRYAPDQYEAYVSSDLGPCDLVAAGGIAGMEISRHERMAPPTKISPIGILGACDGNRINLSNFRIEAPDHLPDIPVILSLGTSMNAGKTLTSTSMVKGFKRSGLRVAALKITGTGAGNDMWIVKDAGADIALDFTDAGFASTYLAEIREIELGTFRLLNHAAASGCEVAVIEIADGLQQRETSLLIRSEAIKAMTLGTMFASYDAMGAKCGVDVLRGAGHSLLGLSGRLGRSPLGVREAEESTGLKVYSPWDLQDGAIVPLVQKLAQRMFEGSHFRRQSLKALSGLKVPHELRQAPDWQSIPQVVEPSAAVERTMGLYREVLVRVADHVMARETAERCGAAFGVRAAGRLDRRNGFRRRVWHCGVGDIEIRVPRLRRNAYTPKFLGKFDIPRPALDAVVNATDAAKLESSLIQLLRLLGSLEYDLSDAVAVEYRLNQVLQARRKPAVLAGSGAWSSEIGDGLVRHPAPILDIEDAETSDVDASADLDDMFSLSGRLRHERRAEELTSVGS